MNGINIKLIIIPTSTSTKTDDSLNSIAIEKE